MAGFIFQLFFFSLSDKAELAVCTPVRVERRMQGVEGGFVMPRYQAKGLILAQNERWRRGLGMQVARERFLRELSKVADG